MAQRNDAADLAAPDMADRMKRIAGEVVGVDRVVLPDKTLGGEDMAFFLEEAQGCFFCLGAGNDAFAERTEAGEITAFYLTDFLVRQFDTLVWKGMGLDRHPELRDMMFGNYEKVVYLSQVDDPALVHEAAVDGTVQGLGLVCGGDQQAVPTAVDDFIQNDVGGVDQRPLLPFQPGLPAVGLSEGAVGFFDMPDGRFAWIAEGLLEIIARFTGQGSLKIIGGDHCMVNQDALFFQFG